jgi:hypothetical protein
MYSENVDGLADPLSYPSKYREKSLCPPFRRIISYQETKRSQGFRTTVKINGRTLAVIRISLNRKWGGAINSLPSKLHKARVIEVPAVFWMWINRKLYFAL